MDCGEAIDFVHRIRLVDDKPFRLPYRRGPPCHYDKLWIALNEMEELGIIRKSQSEYSSPLVLVVKPDGDLRICNDFRWLNARTVACLQMVFSRFAATHLKLSPKKCHFRRRSVKFLGHIIYGDGVKMDPSKVQAINDDVSAVLDALESGGVSQVRGTGPAIPQLGGVNQTASLPKSELVNLQQQDDVLGRVFFYIQRHRRPTRRERAGESRGVMKLLRHWPKFSIKDGMLYRVKKDRQMNMTTHQFVVPDSLKAQVLHGLHDSAGHQG
ncbi:hypothetical protein SKAU_G00166800 [Synaphobranchus kaupii]|uniref:Reverse transcriptase n=1 Tax=Synaphobranchus kaupii TaxID=118154 RepID=A0A9Q1FK61_SYNKA|nr:hypothetical protein SKAU_G00166800 [Synaphobranchus kaupii]